MLRGLTRGSAPQDGAAHPGHNRRRDDFALVRRVTRLEDVPEVERHLPDILGRAMARSWIDAAFAKELARDPAGLLARYSVHLPESVALSVEHSAAERPRIVVTEILPGGQRRRLMYLQLVMMAGR
ncbi:MAG: hypothetical protein AAFQ54_08120 [Pseudomonadota bacterium]